jgi:hypothetical protein
MARTTLATLNAVGPYGSYATSNIAELVMTAADAVNYNDVVARDGQMVVAHNTGASAYTITITSSANAYGRLGNITTYSLGAGEYAIFGPFRMDGWVQSDGRLYFEASNAAVKFGVVNLPE